MDHLKFVKSLLLVFRNIPCVLFIIGSTRALKTMHSSLTKADLERNVRARWWFIRAETISMMLLTGRPMICPILFKHGRVRFGFVYLSARLLQETHPYKSFVRYININSSLCHDIFFSIASMLLQSCRQVRGDNLAFLFLAYSLFESVPYLKRRKLPRPFTTRLTAVYPLHTAMDSGTASNQGSWSPLTLSIYQWTLTVL